MSLLRGDAITDCYKRDVDRSLIRENLKLTPQQRLEKLIAMQKTVAELQRAGRDAKQR